MDELTREEILRAIDNTGRIERPKNIIIADSSNSLDFTSGSPRLRFPNKYKLILSQPQSLEAFTKNEVTCSVCSRVIHYPCWYYPIRYAVNTFHFFVCFDRNSPRKPSVSCYRRNV